MEIRTRLPKCYTGRRPLNIITVQREAISVCRHMVLSVAENVEMLIINQVVTLLSQRDLTCKLQTMAQYGYCHIKKKKKKEAYSLNKSAVFVGVYLCLSLLFRCHCTKTSLWQSSSQSCHLWKIGGALLFEISKSTREISAITVTMSETL